MIVTSIIVKIIKRLFITKMNYETRPNRQNQSSYPLAEPIKSEVDHEAVKEALINHFKKSGKNLDASFMDKARYFAHGGVVISASLVIKDRWTGR